jgi:hypothetical protein
MAETWSPVTLVNDTGQKLNAAYFNRLETGIDQIDVRAATLELGIHPPFTLTASSGVITPSATAACLFVYIATADVQLAAATGGSNGQTIAVMVKASGGPRTVSFPVGGPDPVSLLSGEWAVFRFTYYQPDDTWVPS